MKQAKKNWLIFTPGSLQYCSQNYCTVVPEMTVFHFAEITAFLFPVYTMRADFAISFLHRPFGAISSQDEIETRAPALATPPSVSCKQKSRNIIPTILRILK
jgi:hypothetical protein